MGAIPPEYTRSEKVAMFCIALPYLVAGSAFSLAKRAFPSKQAKPAEEETATPVATLPDITVDPKFEFADRTFMKYFGDTKVCFYQYVSRQHIRALARRNGCTKEVYFTPKIAADLSLPYNMDGAIQYVRQFGFTKGIIAGATLPPEPKPLAQPVPNVIEMEKPAVRTLTENAKSLPKIQSNSQSSKTKPFQGTVLSFGETVRTGRPGEKPYTTYAVKLQSEYGGFEKEFIGEHLSELVQSKDVKVGDLVRIQLLGRNRFEVVVDGRTEERTRNEYTLDLIN